MKPIKIIEEFQIPGTEVILEAGDSIILDEANIGSDIAKALKDLVNAVDGEGVPLAETIGNRFGASIAVAAKKEFPVASMYKAFKERLKKNMG